MEAPDRAAVVTLATEADFIIGRAALAEITDPSTVGVQLGSHDEGDGVVSVYFRADMLGYPGWRWTATIAHLDGQEPSVLETELTPGDGALLAPDWVPWVDRMADYRAAQEADGASDSDDDDSDDSDDDVDNSDEDDDDSDEDEDDDSDEDDDPDDDSDDDDSDDRTPGVALLHAGDLDGVDIDSLLDEGSDDDDAISDDADDDDAIDDDADDDDVIDDDADGDDAIDDDAGDDDSGDDHEPSTLER